MRRKYIDYEITMRARAREEVYDDNHYPPASASDIRSNLAETHFDFDLKLSRIKVRRILHKKS